MAIVQKENNLSHSKNIVSALSLKSIDVRRQAEQIREHNLLKNNEVTYNDYSKEQFKEAWQAYLDYLKNSGDKLQLSNLGLIEPSIVNHEIVLEVFSEISKKEVMATEKELLGFIHKQLKNYSITLKVEVITKEKIEKSQYIFSNEDILKKMIQSNSAVALLQKEFGLNF